MVFFKPIPLGFLLFCLFRHAAIGGASPLCHFCFSNQNYTTNSPYQANLNQLLNLLYTKVPPTGFGVSSTGRHPDQVTGLALCRGDVSSSNCRTCVTEAGKELRETCPNGKGAVIWYDHCMLKYSDVDFIGQIDNANKFYMWNLQEVKDPAPFNEKVKELLSRLSATASSDWKLYANGEAELDESTKLYGLVQCTRDLSEPDCKKCLDGVISQLPNCCDAKQGGRVVGGSCNVRYEIYPFVGS